MQAGHARQNHTKIDESLSISIFQAGDSHQYSWTSLSGQLVHSQLLIACFLQIEPTSINKKELISLFKKEYQGDL